MPNDARKQAQREEVVTRWTGRIEERVNAMVAVVGPFALPIALHEVAVQIHIVFVCPSQVGHPVRIQAVHNHQSAIGWNTWGVTQQIQLNRRTCKTLDAMDSRAMQQNTSCTLRAKNGNIHAQLLILGTAQSPMEATGPRARPPRRPTKTAPGLTIRL